MEHMVFFIVDNMNRGSNLLLPDQKYEVSQLNLSAGEKALTASAFHSASKYLLKGLSLLGQGSWDTKYNLTLRLFDAGTLHLWNMQCFVVHQYYFLTKSVYFIEH
jgi:predicted ATPase